MPWWWWVLGLCSCWFATFGFWMSILPPLMFIAFIFGVILYFFMKTKEPLTTIQEGMFSEIVMKTGIRKLLDGANSETISKIDKRLTGSHFIDESLQEIITYLLRDFVSPWYQKLSSDSEFELKIRDSLQKVVIAIAAKMKDVEWIPYLTTRLVDDAATHLKLYRLVCEKIKSDATKKTTPQSLASFKSATQGSHSRNNSDGTGKVKIHSRNSSISDKPMDFESSFFRIEAEQDGILYHDQLCNSRETEKNYLNDVVDTILYMVLQPEDFQCIPARNLLREIIIGGVIFPLFDALSEPDCINRTIVWLCSDFGVTSEAFLTTIRMSTDKNDLLAIQDFVNKEIMFLRSRDGSCEGDLVKQQLKSLMYIKKIIGNKLQGGSQTDNIALEKLVLLPLSVILTNSLALSYFIDYLSSVNKQKYIFLHMAIEGWKTSITLERDKNDGKINKNQITGFREAAIGIYHDYLSEKAVGRIKIDPSLETQFVSRNSQETFAETWFDEIQVFLLKKISEQVLPEFYRCNIYLKLLSELELLKNEGDESPDSVSLTGSLEDEDLATAGKKHESASDKRPKVGVGKFDLKVDIIDSGVVQDRGKTYGMYAINVVKTYENGYCIQWHVYRRYSDFYDLQQKIKDYYSDLGRLPFPGKKTFNNMGALTLAKRMKMLNDYLQILLHSGVAENHPRLPNLLLSFLEPGEYDKAFTLGSALESMVGPIKSSMKTINAAVRTVPDNLFASMDARKKEGRDENVPVRILLLLMDEVFDLQNRNQWLRRRIVTLLRQVFGDMLSRKLLEYVEELTGATRVAGYIASFKDMLWPNGVLSSGFAERDEACRYRTRVLAQASLLSAADDFKHILGSDTTRRGLLRVFNTFQYTIINRRLVHVLFEGVLELIFPPLIAIHVQLLQNKKKY